MLNHSEIHQRVINAYKKFASEDQKAEKWTPLDSLAFMGFIIELEKEFNISIEPEDLTSERFANANSISIYLGTRLQVNEKAD